ncbi:TRAP transporter substrate-binding protein DctP, partial [Guptibacillus hwajinpoensis]|uniref:TRAP transporter substrate-binding protein DctP n=1 Tax=Guptibacillus hwajinpoensis TaxID=208199 RepID=UPI003D03BDAA
MSILKKLAMVLSTILLIAMLAACGNSGEKASSNGGDESASNGGESKVIKAGIGLNDQHPQYKGLLKFKEIVEEKTDGAITVETYHSGQLGDDRSMTEALQLGTQEVTVPSTAPLANFVPEFSVFDIPFLFPNEEVAD